MATNKQITENNQKLIQDIIHNVENMTTQDFQNILDGMIKFHHYSIGNQLILYHAGASQVAGYHKWKDYNRYVKKHAKAIWILAPCTRWIENKEGDKKFIITGFKSTPVYDIKDTDGEPIEKGFTTESPIKLQKMLQIAEKLGYTVTKQPLEISRGGYITNKHITLNSNLNEAENTGTLIHEISHGLLGHTDNNDQTSKSLKELQAETLTYVLCKYYGIKRKCEFYLKSWGLTNDIMKDLKKINECFNRFIEVDKEVKNQYKINI